MTQENDVRRLLAEAEAMHAARLQEAHQLGLAVEALRRVAGLHNPASDDAAANGAAKTGPALKGDEDGISDKLSAADAALVILQKAATPLDLKVIAKRLQHRGYRTDQKPKDLRANLASALSRRVRRGETFSRPGYGLYGLLEWEDDDGEPRAPSGAARPESGVTDSGGQDEMTISQPSASSPEGGAE